MLALHSDPLIALGGKGNTLWSVGSHENLLPRSNENIHIMRGQLPQVTITAADAIDHRRTIGAMQTALAAAAIQDFDVHSRPTAAYLHIVPTLSKDKARPSDRSLLSRSPVRQRKDPTQQISSGTLVAALRDRMASALAPSDSKSLMGRPRSAPASTDKRVGQDRPNALELTLTHGLTTLSTSELKRQICGARPTDPSSTIVQIPTDKRSEWNIPPTPFTPRVMGNRASRPSANTNFDTAHDLQREPKWRRSSRNAGRFGPVDHIRRHNSTLDARDAYRQAEYPQPPQHFPRYGRSVYAATGTAVSQQSSHAIDPRKIEPTQVYAGPLSHSKSDITLTQRRALQPTSRASTLRRATSAISGQTPADGLRLHGSVEHGRPTSSSNRVDQVDPISPTIPAPTPLPEDSPHKYGLRDTMDTSEIVEPVIEKTASRARRRSSGLEIFNEAKTLQSTSSFLNGLSTSRRRAETAVEPHSDEPSPSVTPRPGTAVAQINTAAEEHYQHEPQEQRVGFKSSGFSYSRPLNKVQLNCYRNHEKMLPSRNLHAPVECAVCHIDSDAAHWGCTWCALRMCGNCRNDFSARGAPALSERTKRANIGLIPSLNQSADSGIAIVEAE